MPEVVNNKYIHNNAQHGDIITFIVRVISKDGRASSWSQPRSIQVGDTTAPPDPINFNVAAGYACCLLTWAYPNCDDYLHTEIFRKTTHSGDTAFYGNALVAEFTENEFRLVGRPSAEESSIPGDLNAEYCFKIRHVDKHGNKSNFSPVICVQPRQLIPEDARQRAGSDNIYIKPANGIPGTDLTLSYRDVEGNIVTVSGKDFTETVFSDIANIKDLVVTKVLVNQVEQENRLDALDYFSGSNLDNFKSSSAQVTSKTRNSYEQMINGSEFFSTDVNSLISTDSRNIILDFSKTGGTVIEKVRALRAYDSSFENELISYINSIPTYNATKRVLDFRQSDFEGTKNLLRNTLTDQAISDAVKSMVSSYFGDYINNNGLSSVTIQEKSDFLLSSRPGEYISKYIDIVKATTANNSVFENAYSQATISQNFKEDITHLFSNVSGISEALDNNILADEQQQQNIESLGLSTASNLTKINGLINTSSEIRQQIDNIITTNGDFQNAYDSWKSEKDAKDQQQNTSINTNSNRISILETSVNLLNSKIALAVTDVIISSEGTMEGTGLKTANANGMKTINYSIDVNSGGLVDALSQDFILRDGVTTSVSGSIVGYS